MTVLAAPAPQCYYARVHEVYFQPVLMCMCAHMHARMHTHIRTRTHTHTHTHTHAHTPADDVNRIVSFHTSTAQQ